ncbi:hypothetical protein [Streptomyces fuscigenes]|uniref:hypothetical protein n=1 Tax=Streptomyces fuscigenes TaxID=1528880 RepID=UPI001F313AF8|nr:hypothetical protein [Streptomyces fuscigenes]MCF3965528.1 hypothetical protein [Streptomyces fuscigenes]
MLPSTPRRRRAAVVGLAAAALLAGSTTTALAAAPAAGNTPKSDGARGICKRLPKVDKRLDRALKRLESGPGVNGSVQRLQKRVDNATSQGDTAIATYLRHRLATRTALLSTVKQRQGDLKDVKTWCAAHDDGRKNGKGAGPSPTAGDGADS